jgi:hypothetical protein
VEWHTEQRFCINAAPSAPPVLPEPVLPVDPELPQEARNVPIKTIVRSAVIISMFRFVILFSPLIDVFILLQN